MSLSMRALSVVPRHAVAVGSLLGGTAMGKTREERGKLHSCDSSSQRRTFRQIAILRATKVIKKMKIKNGMKF